MSEKPNNTINRRHFTFGALLGLLGVKVAGQEKFTGMAGCVVPCKQDARLLKEGEEYCPNGHSQKPRVLISNFGDGDNCMWTELSRKVDWEATNKESDEERKAGIVTMEPKAPCTVRKGAVLQSCSVCGMVYVKEERG